MPSMVSTKGDNMKFLREISEANLTQNQITNLEQFGFTLVWKENSVEVWAEVAG